jgi:uncharacterized RDD family membrane protein YckC
VAESLRSDSPVFLRLGEERVDLTSDRVVVGRSRSCEVRLQEDSVSRLHAAFVWRDVSLFLEDLGSSNGTFVNGRRIDAPCRVQPGDVVRFGALKGTIVGGEGETAPFDQDGHSALPDYTVGLLPSRPAGLGWRFLSCITDLALFVAGSIVPFAPLLAAHAAERFLLAPEAIPPPSRTMALIAGGSGALWVLYAWYYVVHGWARRGGTPGMRLLNLRLVDWRQRVPVGYARALLRLAALLVTALSLGLGFLVVPFRRDRKALHDLLAGTLVVHRPKVTL